METLSRHDPTQADRRQVTILFADVTGFTTLAERLDPEVVREFQNALFAMMSAVIARYDGFVEKFVGDAVMAVFGAPLAHENDPERAIEAALAMVAACARLSDDWLPRLGQRVDLHAGIHTGPVVAGGLGTRRANAYAVTGDTVNTTARILAAASQAILVSKTTYALARHRFAFEPLREMELRGKSERMMLYRLLGPLAQPQSARGLASYGLAAPMVGRDDERDRLVAAFDRTRRGRAQVVCLVGDAGSGKSRLIAEFLADIEKRGAMVGTTVRRTTCSSLGEPTYGVLAALCREGYFVEPDDSLDVARSKFAAGLAALGAEAEIANAIAPVLGYLVGMEAERPLEFDAEQMKRQITLAARELIERRLRQGPVLIIIDDVHWADAASLELLCDVVDHLADRPLMVLLSHRPETFVPAGRRTGRTVIRLDPLSVEETCALVSQFFDHVEGDAFAEIQQFVAARCGGNPLFAEEIVRSLLNRNVMVRREDRWTCSTLSETGEVPPTLHGLLLSRVDALPASARRVLQVAAVLGQTFDEKLLLDVVGAGEDVGKALDQLVRLDLIVQSGNIREGYCYRFTHALVHEVVYENILLARRTELHERAGRALERIAGTAPSRASDLEALAHHWSFSADRSKGVHYLVAAGDRARAVYANEDAIRHYRRAIVVLRDCQDCGAQARTVRERIADVLALTGRRAEALALYEDVRQEFEQETDRVSAARLYRKIGGLHWEAGDRDRAGACFRTGLDLLADGGDFGERAHLFQEIGRLAFRAGDNAGAISWAERALAATAAEHRVDGERAREVTATRAQAHNTLGIALARTGQPEAAITHIEQSIALAEAEGLLEAACRGYANLGVLYSAVDPGRSIETCLRGLETAKKVGDLGFQSRIYANLAVSYCALTDRCEAEGLAAARMAIDLDRRLDLLEHLAVPLIILGQIYQCRGDHALARASYEEALGLAERSQEPQLLFPCYDGLATLSLDMGDQASAERFLAKSAEICERASIEPDALMVLPFLC